MASITLGSLGTSVGTAVGGPLGGLIAQQVGRQFGGVLDNALFGSAKSNRHREGYRLEELAVQTSSWGRAIPSLYGRARIAGNVIWSLPLRETATTTTTSSGGKGGGGGGGSSSVTEYSYDVTLAIAICEGQVDAIERVWADAKQLDLGLGTYRFYNGSDDQLPDALIESYEGVGSTPAYRGLCYVVIEHFPLADYGNRIPNFTFEVRKEILWPDLDGEPLEHHIKELILIPGSGEFVYDTQLQHKQVGEEVEGTFIAYGEQTRINRHTPQDRANVLVALDHMLEVCPNLEWVGVLVNWFGTSMDAGACEILPGVEYGADEGTTAPDVWGCAGRSRGSAHQIAYDGDTPRYGGTPDDDSLIRLLSEIKSRGLKVMLYPFFLMDVADKPWRGRVTGSTGDVAGFFTKTNGYNAYITHYANLCAGYIDAIAIGSELRGLTEVHDGASVGRNFPGVNALVSLAATVKGIVGSGVKVTYAADWSEYHHAADGWYHLDPLWASPHIDVVGIDAYFPLTNAPQSEVGYDAEAIKAGWESGEGYDFYFTDGTRTTTAPLGAAYAWKNIQWWWENTHTNPDGTTTAWVPESKKIWFTEYGFPSVDGATNQPNVFYDPTSSESYFPYHSQGLIDFRAQRAGIAATLLQWEDSDMLEKLFLWTWDARPYPYWPDLTQVWADGDVWRTGHWVQGKFGQSGLAAVVADVCERAGLPASRYDVTRLSDSVDGFVIAQRDSARGLIEQLMSAYFFDAVERDGVLTFLPRGQVSHYDVAAEDLPDGEGPEFTRLQEGELPQRIEVQYLNRLVNYESSTQAATREITGGTQAIDKLSLPLVLSDQRARAIAEVAMQQAWTARTSCRFALPPSLADTEPGDVISLQSGAATHLLRIQSVQAEKAGRLLVEAVAEDGVSYARDQAADEVSSSTSVTETVPVPQTQLHLLDLPAFATDATDAAMLRAAALPPASGWRGAHVYRSDDGGGSYARQFTFTSACVCGVVSAIPAQGPRNRFDEANTLDVLLQGMGGSLSGISEEAMLNGGNLILAGDELLQFQSAELLAPNKYRLSRLLRGRLGTESAMGSHSIGERFILLDARLQKDTLPDGLIGLPRSYKAVSMGLTLGAATAQSFTFNARSLKPYAPVHVTGVRDGAGNLTIRWVRRTRVGGSWRDYSDVPLSEASEAYAVEVLNGSEVVRTLTSSLPEMTYTAAEQITDFGSPQSSVPVKIYQLSSRVGRGEGAEEVL
jgi:hypothetical protein